MRGRSLIQPYRYCKIWHIAVVGGRRFVWGCKNKTTSSSSSSSSSSSGTATTRARPRLTKINRRRYHHPDAINSTNTHRRRLRAHAKQGLFRKGSGNATRPYSHLYLHMPPKTGERLKSHTLLAFFFFRSHLYSGEGDQPLGEGGVAADPPHRPVG